jgi:hypothetical protein
MTKSIIFILSLYLISISVAHIYDDIVYESEFRNFMKKYNKIYPHDNFHSHYEIFKNNYDMINQHNAKNSSYIMAMNQFGDLTFDEFKEMYLGYQYHGIPYLKSKNEIHQEIDGEIPKNFDWRNKGIIAKVRDQSNCGSCYAMSSAEAIESALALQNGKLIELSVQQIVDCSHKEGNEFCNGGLMSYSYNYVKRKGICSDSEYKYRGFESQCKDAKCKPITKIKGYVDVPSYNETELLFALLQRPLSVAMEVSTAFQFYSKGIFDGFCGEDLNHAIFLIGYGEENGKLFWLLQNSWSIYFGEHGYFRLARHDTNKLSPGKCGIALYPQYPVI